MKLYGTKGQRTFRPVVRSKPWFVSDFKKAFEPSKFGWEERGYSKDTSSGFETGFLSEERAGRVGAGVGPLPDNLYPVTVQLGAAGKLNAGQLIVEAGRVQEQGYAYIQVQDDRGPINRPAKHYFFPIDELFNALKPFPHANTQVSVYVQLDNFLDNIGRLYVSDVHGHYVFVKGQHKAASSPVPYLGYLEHSKN